LPTVREVVYDEAHPLNEMGVKFRGVQFSTGQLKEVARDMLSTGWRLARGMADWQGLADGLLAAARLLQGCADRCTAIWGRLPWEMASQHEFAFKEALELLV
jgi:ATP-dependent DNA helicase DinG